jgi:hypothetical protein
LQAELGLLREVGRWAIGSTNPTLRSTASIDTSILAKRVQLRSRSGAKGVEFMHCAGLEASFVGTAAYKRQAAWTNGEAYKSATSS